MTIPRFADGLRLVATRSAITCSRLFVAYTLDKWGAGFLVDEAVLVVDELVTNAVKATGVMDERVRWTEVAHMEFITVRLLGLEASIRIEVWDSTPNPPALPDDTGEVIKRGSYPTARGKVVWAELPVLPRHSQPHAPLRPPPDELERIQPDLDLVRRVEDGLESF